MILPKIILLDLDETIHFSEEMKVKAWTVILKPFGYCWEEESIDGLTSVPKDQRPKSGLSPYDFIITLIDNLGLLNKSIELFRENLTQDEIKYRLELTSIFLTQDKQEKMIEIIKNYWSVSLIDEARRFAEEGKIKEVSGAVEAIMSAHEKRYKIGIVTQAPKEYAEIVLKSLGLLNEGQNNFIDAVVSGDMVENPKPAPDSLIKAMDLIYQQEAIETEETKFGKKLLPEKGLEIRNQIHEEYFGSHETVYPSPVAVVGDSESDIKAGRSYPGTNRIKTILINSGGLSQDEIGKIKPDFTINHFRELLPRLEGIMFRKIEVK